MLATPASQLPVGDQWSYEVKWDGYRTLALKDGSRVTLFSRNLKDATRHYPGVAKAIGQFAAERLLLDGEIVASTMTATPRSRLSTTAPRKPSCSACSTCRTSTRRT
jgi:ATP-dependent DNA ligase